QLAQQFQPLRHQLPEEQSYSSDIPARPAETGDETILDRVTARCEDDRNCGRRRFGREYARKRACEHHSHLTANQVGRKLWQSIVLITRPAVLDRYVLTLEIAGVIQALAKRCHHRRVRTWYCAVEEPDHRHRRLLRTRRERPCCHTADECDDLAPLTRQPRRCARAASVAHRARASSRFSG